MIKILIFIAGQDCKNLTPALKKLSELYPKVEVKIIGTSGVYRLASLQGEVFPFFAIDDIAKVNFDFVLITGGSDDINGTAPDIHYGDIISKLKIFHIPEDKILLDRVLCIPQFTFEKYEQLKKSKPTIFAMNCFGGVIYHRFGMQFYSPIINMFLDEKDMIRFLRAPMAYINSEIKFHKWHGNLPQMGKGGYPEFCLGEDVILHMNHYGELGIDFAKNKWEERKKRINWYNIIPVMYTSNPEVLEEFDNFPFAKKICFVSFKSDKNSAYYLDSKLDNNKELWDLVNRFGLGYNQYNYDLWDMFLYGKKSYY
mgnify:CR=1 FL=1